MNYNVIPVTGEILADTDTPVSAFMKIDDGSEAFLLESVEGGEKWGRYSLLGTRPKAIIRSKNGKVETVENGRSTVIDGDPLEVLKSYLAKYQIAELEGLPRFTGGAIGYMGYDVVRHIEVLPDTLKKELDLYDFCFLITDTLLVFDNVNHKIQIIANIYIDDNADLERLYQDGIKKIEDLKVKLKNNLAISVSNQEQTNEKSEVTSNFTKEEFKAVVGKVKEYIKSGDVIQTVISQRFEKKFNGNPLDIYRALRLINPSPYMFFMRLGGVELAGSSPEILVRVEGEEVSVRPIAGTRPRGRDESEDEALEVELLGDPKERAEHIMLVDLGRNDIGKVAETGSVVVDEFMIVERYSHVMHIVSNVVGKKLKDSDSFDVFRACFPAGTLSGAPKIRAMEIIEELEPCKREIYGGAVGSIGFSGTLDLCITIRTVVIKDDRVYVQAGAGIVADSDPESEFEETKNKAKGVLKAVEMASDGLS